MVEVGDEVFVSPLYGQKDNLAVIETKTPEVGDEVFVIPLYGEKDNLAIISKTADIEEEEEMEGNYNTWTKVWKHTLPNWVNSWLTIDWLVDEVREVISIAWRDNSGDYQFGVFNLSNFSVVFQSGTGSDYQYGRPDLGYKRGIAYGGAAAYNTGGMSRSILSYLLLQRRDTRTLEVWRGGATPLWTHDLDTDFEPPTVNLYDVGISSTGKYIVVFGAETASIALYTGSLV